MPNVAVPASPVRRRDKDVVYFSESGSAPRQRPHCRASGLIFQMTSKTMEKSSGSRSRSRSPPQLPRCRLVLSVSQKPIQGNAMMTWTVFTNKAGHWSALKRPNSTSVESARQNGTFDAYVTCGSCKNANSIDAQGIVGDIFTALRAYADVQNMHFAHGNHCSFRSVLAGPWQYAMRATSKGNDEDSLTFEVWNSSIYDPRGSMRRTETWIYKYSDASDVSGHRAGTWVLDNVKSGPVRLPVQNTELFALQASLDDTSSGLGVPGLIMFNNHYSTEEICRFCIQSSAHHLRWNRDSDSHRGARDLIDNFARPARRLPS